MNGQKLIHIELLVDNPNLKIYIIRRRQVNLNLVHVEPEPESLHLNPVQIGDGSDPQLPRDLLLVVHQVIELHVAGLLEVDLEGAVIGERVGGHAVRQEADREAVVF